LAKDSCTLTDTNRRLQLALEELVNAGYALSHPKVLEVSRQLDTVINECQGRLIQERGEEEHPPA